MSNPVQALIDQAAPGATVVVPSGNYAIDAAAPLRLKSDITLDLTTAVLTAVPGQGAFSIIIAIGGCNNVTIRNGALMGDPTATGGAGIGIAGGSRNIMLDHTAIVDCYDGILILDAYGVELAGVISDHNRRNGMSVTNCDGLHIHNNQFSNNGDLAPSCGIDLECELNTDRIANVLIEGNNVFYGNAGADISFGSPGIYSNCRVAPGNDFDMKTQPIVATGNAGPLGTPWWAFLLNRSLGWLPTYRWWGYPTAWLRA